MLVHKYLHTRWSDTKQLHTWKNKALYNIRIEIKVNG